MKLWIVSFADQYSTNRYIVQSEAKPEIDLSLEEIEFGFTVDVEEAQPAPFKRNGYTCYLVAADN